jgi:NADPH2:quinone reductase
LCIVDGGLQLVERDTPEPVADEVLVEVAGAGLNRADLLQRRGRYPAPPGAPPDVCGLEFSGTVAATGPRAAPWGPGDRVFGVLGGGGHATHVLTTAPLCAAVPDGLDLVAAGGVPEAFVTAHDALFSQARLRAGERLLIHGVASGVGLAALALARAAGACVTGTSRTPAKLDRAVSLGLDRGVPAGDDLPERIGEVDAVLDLVGGPYIGIDLRVCRPGGRIVLVGLLGGARAEIDLDALLRKRLSLTGTVLRTRPDHEKAAATAAFAREVVPLLARGAVAPAIDRIVPLERAEDAYELMAGNALFGKVVLAPRR